MAYNKETRTFKSEASEQVYIYFSFNIAILLPSQFWLCSSILKHLIHMPKFSLFVSVCKIVPGYVRGIKGVCTSESSFINQESK